MLPPAGHLTPRSAADRRALRLQWQFGPQPDGRSVARLVRRRGLPALSGGTRPKRVHPLTIRVLAELGIDWHSARAKPVIELLDQPLDYVITLSDSAREQCPAIPGPHSSLHWHLEDPAAEEGSEEERLAAFRATRTELSVRLRPFIEIARRAAGHLPAAAVRQRVKR